MVVAAARGLLRIHAHVDGRGQVCEREGVVVRRTTSARSYAPVLVLELARPGRRVAQEGTVGHGLVSEWGL